MSLLFLFGLFGIDFNSKLELPVKQVFTLAPLPSPLQLHQGKSAFPPGGWRGGVSGPRAALWNTGLPVQVGWGWGSRAAASSGSFLVLSVPC